MKGILRKNSKIRLIILAIIVIVLAFTISIFINNRNKAQIDNSCYSTLVKRDLDKSISFTGKTVASSKELVTTELISTKVKSVCIKVGDYVEKGDILATFDTTIIKKQIKELEDKNLKETYTQKLAEEQAESALKYIELKKEANVKQSQKLYDNEKKRLEKLQNDYNNYLNKINIGKQKETSKLEVQLLEKQGEIAKCEENLEKYKTENENLIANYDYKLNCARNNIEQVSNNSMNSTFDMKKLKQLLEHAVVKANSSGIVTSVSMEEGGYCSDGNIAEIQDPNNIQVIGYVSTSNLNNLKEGMTVDIITAATGEYKVKGVIHRIEEVSNDKGFEVTIQITDDKYKLKINMDATVLAYIDKKDNCLSIQYDAIRYDKNNKAYVYKLQQLKDDQYIVKKVNIEIGFDSFYYTEISSSDIKENDLILVQPDNFKENQKVIVKVGLD